MSIDPIKILKKNGIGVMPTDTIYGLVGSALSKKAVQRIYEVRKRELDKPFIVLISGISELERFGVKVSATHLKLLKILWSLDKAWDKLGPISIILPLLHGKQIVQKFNYLHRGNKTLAFRLPKGKRLRNFLKITGPLVAPSANIAGLPSAKNITEAKKYFGEKVDFYIDDGLSSGSPSTLIEIKR